MAHKIKIQAVPHINRDGSIGTKKDYVVRCKSRGKVCTHEKFSTRREAEMHVSDHWVELSIRRSDRVVLSRTAWGEKKIEVIIDATQAVNALSNLRIATRSMGVNVA